MTQFVLITLWAIFVTSYTKVSGELKCQPGEQYSSCPVKCGQSCPKSDNDDKNCSIPNVCPKPACVCRFNRRRDNNGACILTEECPSFPCPPNEEYVACPPFCPIDDCSQASLSGECPYYGSLFLVVECNPTCRCIEGYWRKNGTCVPYCECPVKD